MSCSVRGRSEMYLATLSVITPPHRTERRGFVKLAGSPQPLRLKHPDVAGIALRPGPAGRLSARPAGANAVRLPLPARGGDEADDPHDGDDESYAADRDGERYGQSRMRDRHIEQTGSDDENDEDENQDEDGQDRGGTATRRRSAGAVVGHEERFAAITIGSWPTKSRLFLVGRTGSRSRRVLG